MKILKTIYGLVICFSTLAGLAQGFVNLNFESPVLPLNPVNGRVPITNGIPGWIGYSISPTFGTNRFSQIFYNDVSLGAAAIGLHDTNDQSGFLPIAGQYSVFLQGSYATTPATASIGQTGQIPANALSLTFLVQPAYFLTVSFAGQSIPLSVIGSNGGNDILGGDISSFAGQIGELRFTSPYMGSAMIDDIQFSTSSIPEPSTLELLLLSGAWLVARLRKQRISTSQSKENIAAKSQLIFSQTVFK